MRNNNLIIGVIIHSEFGFNANHHFSGMFLNRFSIEQKHFCVLDFLTKYQYNEMPYIWCLGDSEWLIPQ